MSNLAFTSFFHTLLRERFRIMRVIKPERDEESQGEGALCIVFQETKEIALGKKPVFSFSAVDMQ